MPRRVLLRDQVAQPWAAGVNWGNKITRGLVALLLNGRNVVDGRTYSNAGAALLGARGPAGEGLRFTGSSSGLSLPVNGLDTSRGLSIHVIVNPQNLTSTNTFAGFGGATSDRYAVLDLSGTEPNDPIRVIQNSGTFGGTYYESPPTGRWNAYTAVFNGGSDNQLYRDGKLLAPSFAAGSAAAGFPAVTKIDIGQSTQGGVVNILDGGVIVAAHWDRRLTAAEAASLADNPWQLLDLQRRAVMLPLVGGIILTGANCAQANGSSAGTVGQAQILNGVGAAQANTSNAGTVGQSQALVGADGVQANQSGVAGVSSGTILSGAPSSQASVSGAAAIGQTHTINGAASAQEAGSGLGAVGQAHELAGANITQTASSSVAAVGEQLIILAGAPASQNAGSSGGGVTQTQTLAGGDSAQAAASSAGLVTRLQFLSGLGDIQSAVSSAGQVIIGIAFARSKTRIIGGPPRRAGTSGPPARWSISP